MSDNLISEMTLEYLMNKDQYAKYMSNKSSSSSSSVTNNTSTPNRKDRKFYKKRIYDLTKQLMNNEKPERIYPDVAKSFESYINVCIEYFKVLDKSDIIQEDYNGLVTDSKTKNDDTTVEQLQNMKNTEEANKLMMRLVKITEPNSLEKMVKRTRIKNVDSKPVIHPIQKDINLKDPILKNKGIRKKKNITNKYDEKNIQEEPNNKK